MTDREGKVILIGGAVVLVVATWFAFRKPASPVLPGTNENSAGISSSTAATSAGDATGTSGTPVGSDALANEIGRKGGGTTAPIASAPPRILVSFTAPTSSSILVIGNSYDITWNKPAGRTGQLYLVAATSGVIVGWVEQSIGPAQVMFPWKARSVFTGSTSPVSKDVLPGEYILKLWFDSPQVPIAASAPFMIVATTTTATE